MKEFTDKEIRLAKDHWYQHYSQKLVDQELAPYLSAEMKVFSPNNESWLEKARLSLFLSTQTIADELKMTRAGYAAYEASEKKGSITLASLEKAAEAMDCELVYAIRPKNRRSFSDRIWNNIFEAIKNHPWLNKCDQRRRSAALGSLAKEKMEDPQFKKEQNWSTRSN